MSTFTWRGPFAFFWIHYKGGAAIISHDTNPYYPLFWCHQCTHHHWVEDNLMGSSSVVTQWEKRGRGKEWRTGREVRGLCSMWNIKRPSTLYACVCVCIAQCIHVLHCHTTLPSDRNLVVIYAAWDMSAGYAVARHRSDKANQTIKRRGRWCAQWSGEMESVPIRANYLST